MLIDTHTHLYLGQFPDGGNAAVRRALQAGVGHMILPNVDLSTVEPMRKLHSLMPDVTSMAMGLHPTEVGTGWQDHLKATLHHLDSAPADYVAVGEIGIDLYWDKTFRDEQMQAFEAQIRWAVERSLPIIIHCRDGLDEALEVLSSGPVPRGVFHSFGGSAADVERIRRVGDFYFGINGIVTFKNSRLRDTLPAIGAGRILLETDAPYLAPVPHRGKCNESAYMVHTAAHVADALNLSSDSLADVTSASACKLFGLSIPVAGDL